jgi:homoserine dehydrogenase
MRYNLAFIGFGNVGQALARLLTRRRQDLAAGYGVTWRLTGVASRRRGWLAGADGLDVEVLLNGGNAIAAGAGALPDVQAWLAAAQPHVVFEMSSLQASTGQPAIDYIEAGLRAGAHVVTANKGPVVHAYPRLRDLAESLGRGFRFESTVMDGAPIFSLFRSCLPLTRVSGFEGILNSTTNYLLARMEAGADLDQAVREAQTLGLAETDPAADIDGFDAAVKTAALATVVMGQPLPLNEVTRAGIRGLDPAEIRAARQAGRPWKLLCRAERTATGVTASVGPERLPEASPFAQVNGTTSAVHFATDTLPGLTITEHDPTPETTAYGLLADFISLVSAQEVTALAAS